MGSLGEKLVHLSLEIEDRTKSAELLQQLIEDQASRYPAEVVKFQEEQDAILKRLRAECDESRANIKQITESLAEKKRALETQLNELLDKQKAADISKKKNIERVRQDVADALEKAHNDFKKEKAEREKAWFERRVSEINRLTWKGIQPNIERLTRKHKEQCEEIKSKTQFSKQKLDLQCENDLAERVQAFQRSEQQSNSCIAQRTNFAKALAREQNEHAMSILKLKEKFMNDEEATKAKYSLQLETLAKENEVALSKMRISKSVTQLKQQHLHALNARKQELENKLERVGRDITSSKAQWEQSWLEASTERRKNKVECKKKDLMLWRKQEIDELIRKSIVDQPDYKLSDASNDLAISHKDDVAKLLDKIAQQLELKKDLEDRLLSIDRRKTNTNNSIRELEEDLVTVGNELSDITNKFNRRKKQHKQAMADIKNDIEENVKSITTRQDEIEQEVTNMKAKLSEGMINGAAKKDKLVEEHQNKLDELECYAANSVKEIDRKLSKVNNMIHEQDMKISRARNMLSDRYNK